MAGDLGSTFLHPLTPPLEEEERLSWLRLIRSPRVGPATFYRLLAEHGSAKTALAALPGIAADAGIRDYAPCQPEAAKAEVNRARSLGARMLTRGDPDYPSVLSEIADPPPVLWATGDARILQRPMVALVGARNASSLGMRMARRLAQELASAGVAVVSGLARGIDTAAHLGALEDGTVAVLAGGVDVCYPPENAGLARDIAARGLLLSEAPMGTQPTARHFPRRNRIVSGLARAVVVVEAATGSGSLITAKCALDQGREVLAVPGHPFEGRAAGCNALLRDGAALVRSARDVLEILSLDSPEDAPPAPAEHRQPAGDQASAKPAPDGEPLGDRIVAHVGAGPVAEDQLARDLGTSAARLAEALVLLEIEGRITRSPGGLLSGSGNGAD